MISLKKQVEEGGEVDGATMASESPYGYGTCINLSDEQVKALGLQSVRIGQKVRVVAFGIVESLRAEVDGSGGEAGNVYASIQLTDMEATPASVDAASKLYPNN